MGLMIVTVSRKGSSLPPESHLSNHLMPQPHRGFDYYTTLEDSGQIISAILGVMVPYKYAIARFVILCHTALPTLAIQRIRPATMEGARLRRYRRLRCTAAEDRRE